VDVLVEFLPGVRPGLKSFGYGDELSEILGAKGDFNNAQWLSKYPLTPSVIYGIHVF